eukprot:maker-scaffold_8-snap-gene-1.45-mRNA-1 protein AED:0.04 eAED:0.04 QI:78/1/1/1/0/0/2/26/82
MGSLDKPLDLVELSLGEEVIVKCRAGRKLVGFLHAFDQHLNLVLSKVTEEITTPNKEKEVKKRDMLFVRGDGVILLSPKSNS